MSRSVTPVCGCLFEYVCIHVCVYAIMHVCVSCVLIGVERCLCMCVCWSYVCVRGVGMDMCVYIC